ncbi:MAG: molybdenum cofactor biosynthesis protein MoaE, partial [Actinobacteria bacterium]|nr:molybdenum cofactor biosynthesis protein MoaE [Actinomycetota bacterium]NIS35307.1 molybdenum cofactor biosynthesis protein MoaE [Actinomycetota bacterium]NIW76883.1 molybdenum cofactor biosynthesis protein MoaE [Gemmatimonadota bacterium]
GAAIVFLGIVRNHNDGRSVRGMRYEAYSTMAEKVLAEIAEEAAARAGSRRIAIEHR